MKTKKTHLLLTVILLFSGVLKAQTVTMLYNFEDGTTQAGTTNMAWPWASPDAPYLRAFGVTDNPSIATPNSTSKAFHVLEEKNPNWWDNLLRFTLTTPITITSANRYLHILHRRPRIDGGGFVVNLNVNNMIEDNALKNKTRFDVNLSAINEWQDIVIDLNDLITNSVQLSQFNINPDVNNWTNSGLPLGDYFFDEIILSNNPLSRLTTYLTGNNLYDFETATTANITNIVTYAETNNPVTHPVSNPYQTASNTSAKVGKRTALSATKWWTGFQFSFVNPVLVDATHKYLHIMMMTPVGNQNVLFDVTQNGSNIVSNQAANIALANTWQDVVIDVSGMPYISGMAIKCGYWDGTANGDYYFDEIWIDGNSTPRSNATITLTNNNPTMGSISGGGTFTNGVSTTVNATPNAGYRFVNWTENGSQMSTSTSYTFAALAKTLVANFASNTVAINSSTNADANSLNNCVNCDITIANNAILNMNASKTVNSITVSPGAKLTFTSGNTLTATNGIILQSDATGTATLVDNTTTAPQTITGTVQQYLGSARNWYITSPITGATVPSGQTYFSYVENGTNADLSVSGASAYWKPESATSTLDPRKGYIVQAVGESTLSFTGTLNTGTQTPLTLTRTNSASKPGFNLVANPYPSYLDWKLVSDANAGLLKTAWFRTKDNSGGYIFATVNVSIPSNPVIVAVNSNTTITTLIPPMQAYWVRVSASGSTTYTVNNLMRAHADNTGNKFKAPAQSIQPLLRLRVASGSNADETVVLFNANATNGMDMFDSPKMSNSSPSIPEIYTRIGSEKLVINGMNSITYNTEIPLGFSTLTANDFSISANEINNFEAGTSIILIDKLNPSVETELTNGTAYNFSSPVTTTNTDRFSLIFRSQGSISGIENPNKLNAQVFVNTANKIFVASPENANIAIYNVMGQKLYENSLTSTKTTINKAFGAGVYFVTLSLNGQSEIQKVIIR